MPPCRAQFRKSGKTPLWWLLLCVLWVFLAGSTSSAFAQSNSSQKLERAVAAYHNGGYHEASAQLNALLYPLKLTETDAILEARIYLGLCAYILERPEEAAEEFAKVLEVNPRYQLDPLYTPPDILAFFEQLRRKRLQTRPTPSSVPTAPPAIITRTRPQDFVLDLAPLGIAQFRSDRPIHGALLLGGELLLGSVAAATYVYHRDYIYQEPPDTYAQQELTLQRIKTVNSVSFWASTALITYGAADALYRVGKRTGSVTFSPSASPQGVSLTLSGRF